MSYSANRSDGIGRWLYIAAGIAGCAAILNFVAMQVSAYVIGAGGFGARVERDHYFLRQHGSQFIEVSRAVFIWSMALAYGLFITFPIAGALSLAVNLRAPRRMGPDSAPR